VICFESEKLAIENERELTQIKSCKLLSELIKQYKPVEDKPIQQLVEFARIKLLRSRFLLDLN